MKKILCKAITICLIFIILIYGTQSIAVEDLNALQNEKGSVNSQIHESEEDLVEVLGAKSEALSQITTLITQISSYQAEIDDLSDKITKLKSEIKNTEGQIQKDQEEYEAKQKKLNARLVAMYKSGETKYLDYLLSSTNVIDFISSYHYISELTEYDEKMLAEVAAHKEKLEKEKKELEENKTELEQSQKSVVSKQQALEVIKKEKQSYADKLTEEEKKIEQKIQELQKVNDDLDRKIKQAKAEIAAAQAANSGNKPSQGTKPTGDPSSYGLIWPVDMKNNYISAGWHYSSGKLHGAIDIAGSGIFGKPIYAAADGYVVTSTALINSSGSYYSYGNYVLIAHYNGLYTLYGHMSKRVAVTGQTVSQGQIIGYVGSTGNSTGPHLHFEVRIGNGTYAERQYPINYLPKR